jgi:single-strand DNA-binding protein
MLKAQVIGNLGSDPEVRYTASGMAVLSFNVASNGRTKTVSGEWQDSTEWIRCSIFGDRAEKLSVHLARGLRVFVDGRLESRPWIDRTNNPRAGLELVVDSIEFVSSRERDEEQDQKRRQPVAAGARYATGSNDADLEEVPF